MNAVAAAAPATEDPDLVGRARDGDAAAFEQLYRRHVGRIHALCWRFTGGDEARAQDLTQEAFVKAWQNLSGFRGDAAFGTWLHRVAVNVALGAKRTRLRLAETPLEHAPEPSAETAPHGRMDLEAAIAALPDRAREVFVLYAVEGYSHAEIAELTGMAEGSSKAHVHRAKGLLREMLA